MVGTPDAFARGCFADPSALSLSADTARLCSATSPPLNPSIVSATLAFPGEDWAMNCRSVIVGGWLLVCGVGAIPTIGYAQYPEKPITILVGYDVDSVGDQVARGLVEAAKKHLPQPILVVNRPGASGTLAISEALAAKPDGYTLGMGTIGNLTVQPQRTKLSYGDPDTLSQSPSS
jgi:hypothetical protein